LSQNSIVTLVLYVLVHNDADSTQSLLQYMYTTDFRALQLLRQEYYYSYMEIRDLTKEAVLISEDSTFHDALALMVHRKTNSLLVIDEEGKLSGAVDVSDLLNAIVPEYGDPENILEELGTEKGFGNAVRNTTDKPVAEFMSVNIQSVHVDDSLLSIASTAIAHGTQNIPIVDHDDRPLGVISRRGLKHILAGYLGIKDSK